MQLTLWSLPSLAALVLAGHVFAHLAKLRPVPGRFGAQSLAACVLVSSLGQLIGTLFTDLDIKIFADQLRYGGLALLPAAWFAFAYAMVRRRRMTWIMSCLVVAIPLISVALIFTNGWHHWMWAAPSLETAPDGFVVLNSAYGPWMFVQILYGHTHFIPPLVPNLAADIQQVVDRALAKDAADRFSTVGEFARTLEAAIAKETDGAPAPA